MAEGMRPYFNIRYTPRFICELEWPSVSNFNQSLLCVGFETRRATAFVLSLSAAASQRAALVSFR